MMFLKVELALGHGMKPHVHLTVIDINCFRAYQDCVDIKEILCPLLRRVTTPLLGPLHL